MSVSVERRPVRYPELAAAIARDGRPKYQIAAAAAIMSQRFGAILSGKATATPDMRRRIAATLGRPEAELFAEAD